mgnify:CR=1 FL=1
MLGATGGVGGETARALLRHGWQIRGLVRTLRPELDSDIEWFEGDALDGCRWDSVVRYDSAKAVVAGSELRITTQPGDIHGTANDDPRNNLELNNVYPAAGNQTSASSAGVECSPVPGTGIAHQSPPATRPWGVGDRPPRRGSDTNGCRNRAPRGRAGLCRPE